MVSITYKRNGFGPYTLQFNCESEAVNWIRNNEVIIIKIDFMEGQ